MSFFDDASLVMIPSGYKTSKVYSVKPTDGTGDLAFTRSNDTATRVASNGLIEKVRTNRFTYSQNIANAAWKTTTDGGTITKTANAGTAPDGTNTASRLQVAGGGTYSLVYQDNVNPLGSVVVSGYFKRYGGTNQTFRLFGDNGSALSSTFTATDIWQRFSFVMTAASAGADGIAADASNNAYDILVWGMQLETGDVATAYIATTTAAVSVGPVANVPRLDYLNSSCPRLLLEPQRSNIALYSEQLDNAAWGKTNVTITANSIISPDGYQNADTITSVSYPSTSVSQSFTVAAASHTLSCFAKAGTISSFRLDFVTSGFALGGSAIFNLSTLSTTITNFGATSGTTASIVNYGNGWYRCSLTVLATAANYFSQLYPAGNGTMYAWGAQLEAGAYATSYIPTLGASVTRGADAASKTSISSLIGQTEGTIYFEYPSFNSDYNQGLIGIDDGSGNNRILFYSDTNNRITAQVRTNGVTQQPSSYSVSGNVKVAIAYNSTGFVFYVNGTLRFTGTAVVFSNTMSVLTFNHVGVGGSITDQALLFKTRLSNADLASLTA